MKKQFKSSASSGRAFSDGAGLGSFGASSGFGTRSSPLSYVYEPPDLSSFTNSAIVVQFKNLMKKDAITKSKALEEIQAYLRSDAVEAEDALVAAYVKLYPRLSIDGDRRVRQQAHIVLGLIASKIGKRIEPYMQQTAGPWLAGENDPDKGVAKAAEETLGKLFPTKQKMRNFCTIMHLHILKFCRDALLEETPQTLSDERTISKEDSDSVYGRVVSTSINTLQGLIDHLETETLQKESDNYAEIVSDKRIWSFTFSADPLARRATIRFLSACLRSAFVRPMLDVGLIGTMLIDKALASDQTSTASELATVLSQLSVKNVAIWTTEYTGKKAPEQRIRHFIKRGSQNSGAIFWHAFLNLVITIPDGPKPQESAAVGDFMKVFLDGVHRREEKIHETEAWKAYFETMNHLLSRLPDDDKELVRQTWVMPVVSQFLEPKQDGSQWNIPSASSAIVLARCLPIPGVIPEVAKEWPALTSRVIETIKSSQPDGDLRQSQEAIKLSCRPWIKFQEILLRMSNLVDTALAKLMRDERERLFDEASAVLVSSKGEAFEVAALLERSGTEFRHHPSGPLDEKAVTFLEKDASNLLLSPSQTHLIGLLYSLPDASTFTRIWNMFATTLTAKIDLEHFNGLDKLFTLSRVDRGLSVMLQRARAEELPTLAKKHEGIQVFLKKILCGRNADIGEVSLPPALLAAISENTKEDILVSALESLSLSGQSLVALETLNTLDRADPQTLPAFVSSAEGRPLLAKIGALQSSPSGEVANKAGILHMRVTGGGALASAGTFSVDLIRSELEAVSSESVDIETILGMTRAAIGSSDEDLFSILSEIVPVWSASLEVVNSVPMDDSLAIMSALGGMVHLVQTNGSPPSAVTLDLQGLSLSLRVGLFTMEVLSAAASTSKFKPELLAQIYVLLMRTAHLVDDELSISTSMPVLFRSPNPAVVEFVSAARKLVKDGLLFRGVESEVFQAFLTSCVGHGLNNDRISYTDALAYVEVFHAWIDAHGKSRPALQFAHDTIKANKSFTGGMVLAASLCGIAPHISWSPDTQNILNATMSTLTGASIQNGFDKILPDLILLNIVFEQSEKLDGIVAKQRVVFFTKHILEWLEPDSQPSSQLTNEIFIALRHVLPLMSDIYGEHFVTILQHIKETWRRASSESSEIDSLRLCLLHNTIRLYTVFVGLSKDDDPNEDLIDALKENDDELMLAALRLLCTAPLSDDRSNMPQAIVDSLVARLASQVKSVPPEEALALYPLLDSKSASIQSAAISLLQRHTEQTQEQVSFDAALEKKTAHLPEELLSFIFSAPDLDSVMSESWEDEVPKDLFSYLNGWLLVFSHFKKASLKVKEDYLEEIRAGDHLPSLLNIVYEFLGHFTGQPVDVSKYNIVEYKRGQAETAEADAEWLLAHLYYLCLTHLPSLTKTHYLSITNRGASGSISKWIAKYFSPLIIAATMSSVADWANTFSADPEYENFTVKARPRAREISAAYLVDEQTMMILVRLPDAYPLEGAHVESVSRVAVDARKWQAWLRNCQGVIQFSNGDVVDGLSSWRRNVLGALKGQTECYICYSIVSADRQLPSKRCATCKNVFHSACLFKWFKTSNASTCPLCRTAFNYS